MNMIRPQFQTTPCCLLRLCKKGSLRQFLIMILLIIMMKSCVCITASTEMNDVMLIKDTTNADAKKYNLRGQQHSKKQNFDDSTQQYGHQHLKNEQQHRSLQADSHIHVISNVLLSQSSTFQIVMSTLLSILIVFQLLLLAGFIRNRSMRVLEFAQPIVICMFVASSIVITASCFLYVYVSSSWTCAIREPLIFMSVSWMGATVGGRAWRISSLLNNPLLSAGSGSKNSKSRVPPVERVRQCTLSVLSVISGCEYNAIRLAMMKKNNPNGGGGRPIRVQTTFFQMMRATMLLVLPQLLWQVVVLSTPMLRPALELISRNYVYDDHQMVMEQYQCRSSAGFWPNYISVLLTAFPYAIAYLLNVRPKSELDLLPEIIDEREHLKQSFFIFSWILAVAAPTVGLTYDNNPEAKAYGAICAVLALPLACCYYIAYRKLQSIKSNMAMSNHQGRRMSGGATVISSSDDDGDGRSSAAAAVRMAEMYSRIGRVEETVQLVDETLAVFQKGSGGGGGGGGNIANNLGIHIEGRQEIAAGFTANDLKSLEGNELQLIIKLLRLKGNALIKLEGPDGFALSARLNIDALKIFENCPAAEKLKDISFMFPIYNIVGIQMRGGVIDQDDECSLEMELAVRFCREAQLQAYHFARSLASLAEMYGRAGMPDEAFKVFNVMKTVYMSKDHPKLLLDTYSVDRCAVSFATSAVWYLQKDQVDKALERCDYVIKHVLPDYDEKDIVGLYHIFIQLIRVMKWNGRVDAAREAYSKYMPEAAGTHFAVSSIHEPMGLILRICDGSSLEYDMDDLPNDIELALAFDTDDMGDNNFTCDGWSIKSMAAELCMLLARRLDAGNTDRERLIDRGLMMASVAQQRVKASNGMVKHILAYEANKAVHNELLSLIREEVNVNRAVIYDTDNCKSKRTLSLPQESFQPDLKSSMTGTTSVMSAFANRFSVKDDSKTNGSATNSNDSVSAKVSARVLIASKPSHISIGTKKKLLISHMSSMGSNGSAIEFIQENPSSLSPSLPHETPRLQEVAIEGENVDENVSDVV